MTSLDTVDKFCANHHAKHQIDPVRASTQRKQLRKYEAWLDCPIEQAGSDELDNYVAHLINEGYNPNSVVTYMSMIKGFYAWCRRKKIITGDQLLDIREVERPKGAKPGVPKPYTMRQMRQFWLELDTKYPTMEISPRRKTMIQRGTANLAKIRLHAMRIQIEAIVLLSVCCGLRRHEIFRLSLEDVSPDNAYLPILGKGDKEREVPYPQVVREAVVRWIEFRSILGVMHDQIWIRAYGPNFNRAMSLSAFAHMMGKIGEGYELHRLRHSAATNWLREGMPIEQLQRFLGHSDINQTLRYAELNREDIFKSVERHQEGFMKRVAIP